MTAPAREIELKLAAPPKEAEAAWTALAAGAPPGKRLQAVYFDTADRRLTRAGFGLRLRSDGKRRVQTLKGPHPEGFARAEYEAEVRGEAIDRDALAATPAGPLLGEAALERLFSVEVTRRKTVIVQGAAQIEMVLDLGRIVGGGEEEPVSEIELELISGSPRALFVLARRLMRRRPAVVLAFESKAERGLRLVDGPREAPTIDPGMDAAAAFTAIGEAALAQIAQALVAVDREPTPKAVHQLRVAVRRLRSARSAFRPMLDDRQSDAVAAELKWLAASLDETRDLDVMAQSRADADPAFHEVLENARGQARERLAPALASQRRRELPLKVAEWLAAGSWRSARLRARRLLREQPIGVFAAVALDRRFGKLDRKPPLADVDAETRHQRRIQIKKLRYAAEAFAPAFPDHPKRRKRMIAALKVAQETLGAVNDESVGREIAHRLVADSGDIEAAFAAGSAFAANPRAAAKRLKAAQDAWDTLFDATPFWR